MKITMTPTPELTEIKFNGVPVPMRIWNGVTEGGIEVEVYVVSTTPNRDEDVERFKSELPAFMVPNRTIAKIEDFPLDQHEAQRRRAENLHKFGWPGDDG